MARAKKEKPAPKIVWGFDPGKTNFAFCCTEFGTSDFTPLHAGMISNPIRDITQLADSIIEFETQLAELLAWKNPDCIAIERFMNRGKFSGDQGEYVSIMLALVVRHVMTTYPNCVIKIVQPGIWKTAFNRMRGDPPKRQKGVPSALEKATAYALSEPHEFDAYMISHFAAPLVVPWLTGKPYTHLTGAAGGRQFVETFDTVTTGKKKRKRKILTSS